MRSVLHLELDHVVPTVSWNCKDSEKKSNLSSFDTKLLLAWNDAVEKDYFRYRLKIEGSTVIPGKWSFFAELNRERGENRRKPEEFYSVNDPFNPNLFNFTRIKNEEVLFDLKMDRVTLESDNHDLLTINVSPISMGHSLIIPSINKRHNQTLTQHSIELGVNLLLMSATPSFRVAFNSLCGFASVNHLHLHCLYIDHVMKLESLDLSPLEGPCFQLVDYPGKGFAFQCQPKCEDVKTLARNVFKLTSYLQTHNEAHNVVMTRSKMKESDEVLSNIRVYVWARTPNTGSKKTTGFNPAALELFGYFVFKNEDTFKMADETSICEILEELTSEPFTRNCEQVRQLFQTL